MLALLACTTRVCRTPALLCCGTGFLSMASKLIMVKGNRCVNMQQTLYAVDQDVANYYSEYWVAAAWGANCRSAKQGLLCVYGLQGIGYCLSYM